MLETYGVWLSQGSPIAPDQNLYNKLLEASELHCVQAEQVNIENRQVPVTLELHRQAVTLVELKW